MLHYVFFGLTCSDLFKQPHHAGILESPGQRRLPLPRKSGLSFEAAPALICRDSVNGTNCQYIWYQDTELAGLRQGLSGL